MAKYKSKLIAANIGFIDPVSAGSTVGYKIVEGSRATWAEVDLTDCNRKINWSFYASNSDDVAKIDRAIAMLTEFRDKWAEVVAKPRPVKRRRKKTVAAAT